MDAAADITKLPAPAEVLLQLVELARSAAKALTGQRHLTKAEHLLVYAISHIGAPILDPTDRSDLDRRIREAAQDPALFKLEALLTLEARRHVILPPEPSSEQIRTEFAALWGPSRVVELAAGVMSARLGALRVVHKQVAQALADSEPDEIQHTLQAITTDFRVPAQLRGALLDTMAAEVALFALLAPIVDPNTWRTEAWSKRALLEHFIAGSVAHLKLLLLTTPGLEIDEGVVPLDDRFDRVELAVESATLASFVINSATVAADAADAFVASLQAEVEPHAGTVRLFSV